MGKISKITLPDGSSQFVKDKALTESVEEMAEVVSSALNDLHEIDALTSKDYDEIFGRESGGGDFTVLYTEDFLEYDPDTYAEDNDYSSFADVDDYPALILKGGGQKFEKGDQTLEYEGETYDLWRLYTSQSGEWSDAYFWGLLKKGLTKESLVANSMATNASNRFEPVVAVAQDDTTIYSVSGNEKYCLVYVE